MTLPLLSLLREANQTRTIRLGRKVENLNAIRAEVAQNLRRAAEAPLLAFNQHDSIFDRYAGNHLNQLKRNVRHGTPPESESGTLAQFKSLTLSPRSLMDRPFTSILAPVCETTV